MMLKRKQRLRLLMLTVLVLSAAGCSNAPARWQVPQPVAIPPLPTEARQGPTPLICSPTCSDGLASELKSLRELQTALESLD